MTSKSLIEDSVSIVPVTGCWLWMRGINVGGYGRIKLGGKWFLAHRLSYEAFVGALDNGLVIDHLCRNRWCVNPCHLEQVTNRTNIVRGISPAARSASAARCVNGHDFTCENTYERKGGGRACRACGRIKVAAYKARKRALEVMHHG